MCVLPYIHSKLITECLKKKKVNKLRFLGYLILSLFPIFTQLVVLCLQIRKQVPDVVLEVEREGHSHAFSCTESGSLWVAHHVTTLIKNHHLSNLSQ